MKLEKHNIYEFKLQPELFLFGDIYVAGFGFAECEFDLWWLLRHKQREIYADGKVYFYEHDKCDIPSAKQMLLTVHEVKIEYNEFPGKNDKFKDFYEQAYDDAEVYLLTIYYKKDDNRIPTNQEIIELVETYCM